MLYLKTMNDNQWLHEHFYQAGRLLRKAIDRLPVPLADAAIVAGKVTADALAKRPGVQASLQSLKMRVETGKAETHEAIEQIDAAAEHIIGLLHAHRTQLQRLAVDGVPGSGKSTLARSLAKKLQWKVKTLDYIDLNRPQDFSQLKAIYEHHRLLRTQDIDNFDAIIYIDEPVELSLKKCLHRKRGGINVDIFDYPKLKKIGQAAFAVADGRAYPIANSYIKVKIRPQKGFRACENIRAKVQKKGLKVTGYSKEQLLFLSVYGQAAHGLMAYVNFGAYNEELLKGLSAGALRFLTT